TCTELALAQPLLTRPQTLARPSGKGPSRKRPSGRSGRTVRDTHCPVAAPSEDVLAEAPTAIPMGIPRAKVGRPSKRWDNEDLCPLGGSGRRVNNHPADVRLCWPATPETRARGARKRAKLTSLAHQ